MIIGLGLIVRNEQEDIGRCLGSFVPQVDKVCIIDTGSDDRTIEFCRAILDAYPHLLEYKIERITTHSDAQGRLCNFGEARNEYVRRLRDMNCDYILSADADDSYVNPPLLRQYLSDHPADIYNFKYWLNDATYMMSYKLWRADRDVSYKGRVHEYLHFNWGWKILDSEIAIRHHVGHHEGQEHGTKRNMRILKDEIYPPLRSLFYWANENVDAGNYPEAIRWYLEYIRRAKAGEPVWIIELAHCYFRAARWINHLGNREHAKALSLELVNNDPSWSEAWCELAWIAQLENNIPEMRKYAQRALENTFTSRLFSEKDKYTNVPANMLVYCDMIEKSNELKTQTNCCN